MKLKLKPFLFVLLALAVLSPIGLLASGTAWGEWEPDEIEKLIGHVPAGLAKLKGVWKALMPDYGFRGWDGFAKSAVGYVISALLGICLIAGISFVVYKLLARNETPAA